MIKIQLFEEPELFFKENRKCLDPQVGLLNYGPHGGFGSARIENFIINAGVIGTERSINATKLFLKRIKNRINADVKYKGDYKGIDYPGLNKNGILGFDIEIDRNCSLTITRKFVRFLKNFPSRKNRIIELSKKYCEKLDDLQEAHPAPDLVFLPIDDEILSMCKERGRKTDKIVYQRRDFGNYHSIESNMFDFHNYIKAQSGIRGFTTQMITPQTLIFSEKKQSNATIAWNFTVASYYKATGIPWKLSEIDDDTCYIGISFYRDISNRRGTIRASLAQVYMRTGESQVISGRSFDWDREKQGRQVHLDEEQMNSLVNQAIDLFKRQRKRNPSRIVVHKSSRFSDEEIRGCLNPSNDLDIIDIVHISDRTKFRSYHEKSEYPVLRGMSIGNERECMLYTYAYIPILGTYLGPSAPSPIHIKCQRIDSSIETICQDILGLTKLDWNTSLFCTKMPVTIGVSRKVGDVLSEIVAGGKTPPRSYKYYM